MANVNYQDWVKSLNSRGIKTTSIDKKGNEANFFDYGNALSNEVQKTILDSFDKPEDKTLQSHVAGLMSGKSVVGTNDMIKLLDANGIKMVPLGKKKSTIITDEKTTGHGSRATKQGVNLYEISDGKGGKFTIADANGNSFIESEELFMNEILSGVSSDIAASTEGLTGPKSINTYNQLEAQGHVFDKPAELEQEMKAKKEDEIPQDKKIEISKGKFEDIIKDLMDSKGWSEDTAKNYVLLTYSVRGLDEKQAQSLAININIAA